MHHLDRRQRTLLRAVVCVAAGLLAGLPQPGIVAAAAVAALALAIGRWFPSWPWILVTGSVMLACMWTLGALEPTLWPTVLAEVPFALLRFGAPSLIGLAWRFRVQLRDQAVHRLEERNQRLLDAEQRKLTQLRLRLADELHDDLGHTLSLLALRVGRLELDGEMPERARAELAVTRRDLAEAVERLGESVRTVRSTDEADPRRGESLSDVLDRARSAGVEVVVHGVPDLGLLEGHHCGDVARVLRELITNAVKHAPGHPTHLEVRREEALTVVDVWNAGGDVRAQSDSIEGRWGGLDSLRRDIETAGGSVTVTDGQAFRVVVRVPDRSGAHGPAPETAPSNESASELLASSDLRGRLVLIAAAFVVLGALAGVELLRVSS